MAYLAPSVLSADILQLKDQIQLVEENGADYIHIDIMDGHFVPNITFGPVLVEALKKLTDLPLDVHLMITEPERYIENFAKAGADYITVHYESTHHLDRALNLIGEYNAKAGVALNPATSVRLLEPVLNIVDLVLIMSVNPGFGGQKFITYTYNKLKRLIKLSEDRFHSFLVEVDGGINENNIVRIKEAGANLLVAGNAIFGQNDIGAACRKLKDLVR
jgi:ribulose-phosphate 3-epimerase